MLWNLNRSIRIACQKGDMGGGCKIVPLGNFCDVLGVYFYVGNLLLFCMLPLVLSEVSRWRLAPGHPGTSRWRRSPRAPGLPSRSARQFLSGSPSHCALPDGATTPHTHGSLQHSALYGGLILHPLLGLPVCPGSQLPFSLSLPQFAS